MTGRPPRLTRRRVGPAPVGKRLPRTGRPRDAAEDVVEDVVVDVEEEEEDDDLEAEQVAPATDVPPPPAYLR